MSLFYSKPSRRAWDFCDLLNFYINTNECIQWASNMLFSQHGFIAGQLDSYSFWQVINFLHQYYINSDLSILYLKLETSKYYYIGRISGKRVGAFFWGIHWFSFMMSSKPLVFRSFPKYHTVSGYASASPLPTAYSWLSQGNVRVFPSWAHGWEQHRNDMGNVSKFLQNRLLHTLPRGIKQWYILIKKKKKKATKPEITNHLQNLDRTFTVYFCYFILNTSVRAYSFFSGE